MLAARPQTTVTAVDIYDGFWGISDNTPERFLANAKAGGFAAVPDADRAWVLELLARTRGPFA